MNLKNNISIILLLAISIFSFIGCEEEPPFINCKEDGNLVLRDTNYISTNTLTPQDKSILLYDVTGVRCNNCPTAAKEATRLQTEKGNKLVVVALYPTSGGLLTLPWPGYENLTNDFAQQIVDYVSPFTTLPVGYVDQTKYSGQILISYPQWEAAVNEQLKKSSPVNIELDIVYDTLNAEKEIVVSLKMTYTEDITATDKHKFTLGLMQSHIVSKQTTPTGKEDHYIHNHALRTTATLATGELLKPSLVKGRVIEKDFKIKLEDNWKPYECTIFAYIHDADTKEVYQAKDKHL